MLVGNVYATRLKYRSQVRLLGARVYDGSNEAILVSFEVFDGKRFGSKGVCSVVVHLEFVAFYWANHLYELIIHGAVGDFHVAVLICFRDKVVLYEIYIHTQTLCFLLLGYASADVTNKLSIAVLCYRRSHLCKSGTIETTL